MIPYEVLILYGILKDQLRQKFRVQRIPGMAKAMGWSSARRDTRDSQAAEPCGLFMVHFNLGSFPQLEVSFIYRDSSVGFHRYIYIYMDFMGDLDL